MASVMAVVDVEIRILKSHPVQWSITAHGVVGSGGWSNLRLEPRYYISFPEDGIQDLDFVGDAPSGIAIQPILPVIGSALWPDPPQYVKGVRVHSATNSVEKSIEEGVELRL